ncbi:LOG family protein [Candidatus Protochlamydia phocaeensis]|uniref:LOG family protein n=1 Tax=Candidatus Protochlamydia phocaeensis TaxID=1414722 RepID=UPI0008396F98|nr:LOG family protein [Candidatus Protochlamydia phocaeensis]
MPEIAKEEETLPDPFKEELNQKINDLLAFIGAKPDSLEADLVGQIIYGSLKMAKEGYDLGQLKLMTRAFKEMRYAYRIFNQYPSGKRISIFGSARTPPDHPDYVAAKAFSAEMARHGWVCITGAADGIMKAGLEGAQKESSFGLSIRLPFEAPINSLLAGDPKLITFRYFFTRKLMFLSHSDAIAAFPGGVGTQDELFEVLTLIQTGKANIVPVVLLEGEGRSYWQAWMEYVNKNLLDNGWISSEDLHLFYRAPTVEAAAEHIQHFYHRYHSSRYVKDILVIRMLTPLTQEQIESLHADFAPLLKSGTFYSTSALPEETDHLNLPRLAFEHNHKHFGLLRLLIDRVNDF